MPEPLTCIVCGAATTKTSLLGWHQAGEGAPIVAAVTALGEQPYCTRHFPRKAGQVIDVKEFPK